jgi:uncharacterized protein (DUF362 family)
MTLVLSFGCEAMVNRRQFIRAATTTALTSFWTACDSSTHWDREAYRKPGSSKVAILKAKDYDHGMVKTLTKGIEQFRLNIYQKSVILKPNLVEFDPKGVINTHPTVIAAAIESFRALGAREVLIAEGPGHRRDNEHLLVASGLYQTLKDQHVRYVDLNYDDVRLVKLRSNFTNLQQLYLPQTLHSGDLLVSMPKLKTHHWAGVTLSLKNMFGVVPGSVYGWPKNILHWAGIDNSILDINSSLPIPQFAIIDGIVGMEGNGPLQGLAKHAGVLILGNDLVAVDATAARLMRIEPQKIRYLAQASEFLGNIVYDRIEQIGERLEALQQDFRVLESFQYVKKLTG